MFIELVMLSNYSISAAPSPFAFSLTQHQGLFQWVGSSHSFRINPPNEYSGLISFRIDSFDPCNSRDSQESSPTQFKSIKTLQHSAAFVVQLSHPYMTTGKITTLAIRTFVGKVMSLLFNMLSRFVIAFFQGASIWISWLQAQSALDEPKAWGHLWIFGLWGAMRLHWWNITSKKQG